MPRPLLWDVDDTSTPPRMTICFVGRPNRYISVRIREPGATRKEAEIAAVRELEAFTPEQVLMLAESSQAMPVAVDPFPVEAIITPVEQEERYPGVVHCPACCHALGRGNSPSIGYLDACSACKRQLTIKFVPGAVMVILFTP